MASNNYTVAPPGYSQAPANKYNDASSAEPLLGGSSSGAGTTFDLQLYLLELTSSRLRWIRRYWRRLQVWNLCVWMFCQGTQSQLVTSSNGLTSCRSGWHLLGKSTASCSFRSWLPPLSAEASVNLTLLCDGSKNSELNLHRWNLCLTLTIAVWSSWALWIPLIGTFVNLGFLYWQRHSPPWNYVLLSTFTLLEAYSLGVAVSFYENIIVLQALYVA